MPEDARHATRVRLPFGRRQQRLRRQRQGWAPRRYRVTARDMSDGTIRTITSTLLGRSRDESNLGDTAHRVDGAACRCGGVVHSPFRGPAVTLQPNGEGGMLTRSGTRDGLEGGHGVCKEEAVAPSIAVGEERGLTKSVLQQRMSGVQGSSFNTGNVLRCYFVPKFVRDDDSPAPRQCGMQLSAPFDGVNQFFARIQNIA
ncbi:hypothetical protein PI126_g18431 [Phytophthora idaei]|nr:hypothetical protein PI126_g18431 [Phytophthora idaei]